MRLQHHWDARAAANFILGGAGAGLMVAAAFFDEVDRHAIVLSLVLVAAGLAAVWLEIGRKLRALHVLFNPLTSWMTRESFAAVLLFPLGLGAYLTSQFLWAAALAAAAFLYCQARILRAARGIPAWRAPELVPLVILTGLTEGAGLLVFFTADPALLALLAAALLARAAAWGRYRRAVKFPVPSYMGSGTVAALALLAASLAVPQAALAAALAAIGAGWHFKLALVTRAAFNQGYALPHLPVRGTR